MVPKTGGIQPTAPNPEGSHLLALQHLRLGARLGGHDPLEPHLHLPQLPLRRAPQRRHLVPLALDRRQLLLQSLLQCDAKSSEGRSSYR